MNNKKLVLANGKEFHGYGFGSEEMRIGPIIYNTSMVGYQEVLSNPAMCDSIVLMTYPLIGNYGLTDDDYESKNITMAGFIAREYNEIPSNFRYTKTLKEVMEENKVAGISGIDTRELTNIIRQEGSMFGMICDGGKPLNECLKELREYKEPNYINKVSSKKTWFSRTRNPLFNVVIIDCGVKLSTIKVLNQLGCNVTVIPYNTSYNEIMKLKPNGVLISSGPGDPNQVLDTIEIIKSLVSKVPLLGIALGAEIGVLALGGNVIKKSLKRIGNNHPCRNIITNKIDIVSREYLYEIDKESIMDTTLQITHINILDDAILGLKDDKVILVQFTPDENIINEFINLMSESEVKSNA